MVPRHNVVIILGAVKFLSQKLTHINTDINANLINLNSDKSQATILLLGVQNAQQKLYHSKLKQFKAVDALCHNNKYNYQFPKKYQHEATILHFFNL